MDCSGDANACTPRPTSSRVTTADGRSPGSRVVTLRRLPRTEFPVASDERFTAYSCGGSRGVEIDPRLGDPAPHSLLISVRRTVAGHLRAVRPESQSTAGRCHRRSGPPPHTLSLSPSGRDIAPRNVDARDRGQFAGGRDDRGLLAAAARADEADLMRGRRPARPLHIGGHRPGIAMRARHQKSTGIEHTHFPSHSASLPLPSMTNPCESFRCPSTAGCERHAGAATAALSARP